MKTAYLCGAIHGCTDDQCRSWRDYAKTLLPDYTILDPLRRDYRGKEETHIEEIVELDIKDIDSSDILLVNAKKPSWGTAMELFYAYRSGKIVISIAPDRMNLSPWLHYHSSFIVGTVEEACEVIRRVA